MALSRMLVVLTFLVAGSAFAQKALLVKSPTNGHDGKFVVDAGSEMITISNGPGQGNGKNAYVVTFDRNGNPIGTPVEIDGPAHKDDVANDATSDGKGGVIVTGNMIGAGDASEIFVADVRNGVLQFLTQVPNPVPGGLISANEVAVNPQGGIAVTGFQNGGPPTLYDGFLRCFTAGGNPVCTNVFTNNNLANSIDFGSYVQYDPTTGNWIYDGGLGVGSQDVFTRSVNPVTGATNWTTISNGGFGDNPQCCHDEAGIIYTTFIADDMNGVGGATIVALDPATGDVYWTRNVATGNEFNVIGAGFSNGTFLLGVNEGAGGGAGKIIQCSPVNGQGTIVPLPMGNNNLVGTLLFTSPDVVPFDPQHSPTFGYVQQFSDGSTDFGYYNPLFSKFEDMIVPGMTATCFANDSRGNALIGTPGFLQKYINTTLVFSPNSVIGGASATGKYSMSEIAPPSGLDVELTGTTHVHVPSVLHFPAGGYVQTFTATTDPVATTESDHVQSDYQATINWGDGVLIDRKPGVSSFTVTPSTVVGGAPVQANVTLTGKAPAGGLVLNVTANSGVLVPPPTFTVPAGQSMGSFTIGTLNVSANATRYVTIDWGDGKVTDPITVTPGLISQVLDYNNITGGDITYGTVTLGSPASVGGVTVHLQSNSGVIQVPSSVLIPQGQTSVDYVATTSQVGADAVRYVTATLGNKSIGTALTLTAQPRLQAFNPPLTVEGGTSIFPELVLTGHAPAPRDVLISYGSSIFTGSPVVTLFQGQDNGFFNIDVANVGATVTRPVTAKQGGVTLVRQITVVPFDKIKSLTLNPQSVKGGSSSTATLTLTSAAITGGATFDLTSGDASAQVPAHVTVPAGQTSATFTVTTTAVASPKNVLIKASRVADSKGAILNIHP